MPVNASRFLTYLGTRIQNYGYLLANPDYSKVRLGKGCGDLYRLLNKDWFPRKEIQLVLDAGANEGQFIRTALALMPEVMVYAFEPNPEAVKKLKTGDWNPEKVKILPVALGSQEATLPLNISKFSPSSSFFKISDQMIAEFPETETEQTISVNVGRLDTLLDNQDVKPGSILLKIDVQGFELEVLEGAIGLFNQISIIVCEINLAPLYEGQCTIESIVAFLRSHGYKLVDIGEPIRSRYNQEILYLDLAFKKEF